MARITILLIVIVHGAYAQNFFSKSISLRIDDDSLTCVRPCSAVCVSMTVNNDSDNDILVYGLMKGGPAPAFSNIFNLCDLVQVGTGIQFALFHPEGSQEMAEFEIVDKLGQKPVTRERVDSALREMRFNFLKSAMVLKKHESKTFLKEVPLQNFYLRDGLYYLQMVYYCGNKTAETLNLSDIRKSGAKLFQGCAISEKIPFVVK